MTDVFTSAGRSVPIPLFKISRIINFDEDPCGWCGQDGCKTELEYKHRDLQKNPTIHSTCIYHYIREGYAKLCKPTQKLHCTNMVIECPLCTDDLYHPITFWKYNLIQHMLEYHLDNGKLPPFPAKLRASSHISRAEEESMGVELMKTMEYRTTYHLPNTSDIAPSHSAQAEEESMDGELEPAVEGRKRTFSVISQTSTTASRMPPYSKILCT